VRARRRRADGTFETRPRLGPCAVDSSREVQVLTIAVSLDGASQGTVNANAAGRHAQQTVYTVSGLTAGRHTLTLTKNSGTYLVIDRFDVK